MAFYGYPGDADNCYWTPYSSRYDYDFASTPIQPEMLGYESFAYFRDDSVVNPLELHHSVYTNSEPKIEPPTEYHYSYSYYGNYGNPSEITYTEPKFLQYNPLPSETRFTISYSAVEFNEPDWEEYDPTPYDGGYDIAATYGKPLPPSDSTCYPRSKPQSDIISEENNFSYASIPSPYGKNDDNDLPKKPPNGSKPMDANTDKKDDVGNGDKVTSGGTDRETVKPPDVKRKGDPPTREHENGFGYGAGDYEMGRQVSRLPYGSGLEAMDICEGIFGYWPCLDKIAQQQKRDEVCEQERRMDQWKSAADYLFGGPIMYGYDNHHQHQQVRYDGNSWLQ